MFFLTIASIVKEIVIIKVVSSRLKLSKNKRKLAIVGSGELGQNFKSLIDNNLSVYSFEGFIDEQKDDNNERYLGNINEFENIKSVELLEQQLVRLRETEDGLIGAHEIRAKSGR